MISDLESNEPPISMKGLYHQAIGVAIQPQTISVIESAILRFQRHDSITMPSQSPNKKKRYLISNQRSLDSYDTSLSPWLCSLQTNRDDIGSRISDPPIPKT
ncbi:hypothetical protein AVEN_180358-1 [Araneus ventricosus]|uniref:Uncharacterized protein n=1 Tax=Araneus ventricosus TaxID=182803 RepID=A0A4Y2EK14_ARAVE|nr:hypothetical protein AVEN_180358-1 [Araneus ventricosus]